MSETEKPKRQRKDISSRKISDKDKIKITKKQFEDTLVKVFASDRPTEGGQEARRTSKSCLSDGYSGKRKNRGKTVDKGEKQSD